MNFCSLLDQLNPSPHCHDPYHRHPTHHNHRHDHHHHHHHEDIVEVRSRPRSWVVRPCLTTVGVDMSKAHNPILNYNHDDDDDYNGDDDDDDDNDGDDDDDVSQWWVSTCPKRTTQFWITMTTMMIIWGGHLKTHTGEKSNNYDYDCDYASSQAGDLRTWLWASKCPKHKTQFWRTNIIMIFSNYGDLGVVLTYFYSVWCLIMGLIVCDGL